MSKLVSLDALQAVLRKISEEMMDHRNQALAGRPGADGMYSAGRVIGDVADNLEEMFEFSEEPAHKHRRTPFAEILSVPGERAEAFYTCENCCSTLLNYSEVCNGCKADRKSDTW